MTRPTPGRWGDLRLRVASSAVLIPIALGCIWAGGVWFAELVALVSIALAYEWLTLCRWRLSALSLAVFTALPLAVVAMEANAALLALVVLLLGFAAALPFARAAGADPLAPFGVPYLGLGCVGLVWLRLADPGEANVVVLLLIVWASDIGAYMVGRAVGGRKLAPAISPGKTVSGAVGGLVAAMAVGLAACLALGPQAPLRAVLLAGLTGCVAQAGDLFESGLKRHFGVKDSGRLIPGHGGVLDRLDALVAAAPFAALLALILGRGVVIWR
ncbi:MAG TPA: phosphatidate cytidylyltransferase [Rhodopila sp.]|uniref:phosphatidate cytidylyltransferase n=1 Tax=Rhodopila sp. TaxID=2480087 RepID=UPI002C784E3B|nr:phosphatidate cytidylyltransferase [Rhodopila sp.]HVY18319.1 phosphatidate cytidylyltransferase [Rhodopila sp.]